MGILFRASNRCCDCRGRGSCRSRPAIRSTAPTTGTMLLLDAHDFDPFVDRPVPRVLRAWRSWADASLWQTWPVFSSCYWWATSRASIRNDGIRVARRREPRMAKCADFLRLGLEDGPARSRWSGTRVFGIKQEAGRSRDGLMANVEHAHAPALPTRRVQRDESPAPESRRRCAATTGEAPPGESMPPRSKANAGDAQHRDGEAWEIKVARKTRKRASNSK